MRAHLQQITVTYEYPIYFTTDVFSPENPDLVDAIARKEPGRRHRLLVVVDASLAGAWPALVGDVHRYARYHADRLALAAAPLVIAGGEQVKNDPQAVAALQARIDALGLDRQSAVVCVGGGALQDMVGFAAATAHRGLRVVRLPTTVLAQDDSGVGVKNAINAFGKKNFLGTFAPPFAVLNDRRFLASLPPREAVAGMAEAVKVALIRDADFFAWLGQHADALAGGDPDATAYLVRRSAELHLRHIATGGDPFEFGSARPLDFGHWAAHKLESLTEYRLRHGEAVAIGVALDTLYSAEAGLLDGQTVEPVLNLLARLGLPLWDEAIETARDDGRLALLDGLAEFREHLGGELTVTLLTGIGRGVEVHEMHEALVLRAMDGLRSFAAVR